MLPVWANYVGRKYLTPVDRIRMELGVLALLARVLPRYVPLVSTEPVCHRPCRPAWNPCNGWNFVWRQGSSRIFHLLSLAPSRDQNQQKTVQLVHEDERAYRPELPQQTPPQDGTSHRTTMSQTRMHVAIAGAGIAVCDSLTLRTVRHPVELTGNTRVSALLYCCSRNQSHASSMNCEPALPRRRAR
jgi:hypothetical protein